jgi:hypothetical protein
MFTVRATESWGAPEDVQAAFLLEGRLELTATTEPVFWGRERGTGHYMWIKCSDGSRESHGRLVAEERLLHGLEHPHVLPLIADHASTPSGILLFRWCAEQPLTAALLADMPCVDRARLAGDVLDAVQYLQTHDPPVAHARLTLENLWVTPRVRYLQLAGFNYAQAGADEEVLVADRRAVVARLAELIPTDELPSDTGPELDDAAARWLENPAEGYDNLSQALRRGLLACVTADL